MCKFALTLAVLIVTLVTPVPQPDGKKEKEKPDYYPLRVGNKWEYEMDYAGQKRSVFYEITKNEVFDGVTMARLESTGAADVGVGSPTHMVRTDEGVFIHRTRDGINVPPLRLIAYPIKEDQTWTSRITMAEVAFDYTSQVGKWEEVETPAGKFKAISLRLSSGGGPPTIYWYAANVGVVRREFDIGALKVVMKLKKFDKGK